jgi:hypothetical protein
MNKAEEKLLELLEEIKKTITYLVEANESNYNLLNLFYDRIENIENRVKELEECCGDTMTVITNIANHVNFMPENK